jgi:hypothetical protein
MDHFGLIYSKLQHGTILSVYRAIPRHYIDDDARYDVPNLCIQSIQAVEQLLQVHHSQHIMEILYLADSEYCFQGNHRNESTSPVHLAMLRVVDQCMALLMAMSDADLQRSVVLYIYSIVAAVYVISIDGSISISIDIDIFVR